MNRHAYREALQRAFTRHPCVALLGPRQSGKTTLARDYLVQQGLIADHCYFDLERPSHLARLNNPEITLSEIKGLIVLDEIQRRPDLFPVLRSLIDDPALQQQFLILGSASPQLIMQASESLAGRIEYQEVMPFNFNEAQNLLSLWIRGGFPRAFLAADDEASFSWREHYIRTYLEMDIPQLGIKIPAMQLYRFWQMLTHCHGQIFNASDIGRSLNLSHNTIRHYLDILSSTFMLRQLQPWFSNIKKRQVKHPKIYFRDSGLLHCLLGCKNQQEVWMHPRLGASWEGFALEEIIRAHGTRAQQCFFWSTHADAELDLLLHHGDQLLGFEFKYTDAPKLTRSMQIAKETLGLTSLTVIYPGKHSFMLSDDIKACGLAEYLTTHYAKKS